MKGNQQTGQAVGYRIFLGVMVAVFSFFGLQAEVQAKSLYVIRDTNHAMAPVHAYNINPNGTLDFQRQTFTDPDGNSWGAIALAIDSESGYLFMNKESSDQVAILDGTTMNIVAWITAPGASDLAGLVYDHGHKQVYAVDRYTNDLFVWDWDPAGPTLTLRQGMANPVQLSSGTGNDGVTIFPDSDYSAATVVAPLWYDWDPSTAGNITYETKGTLPNRQFIVSWNALPECCGTPVDTQATFQVVLYEGSSNIDVTIEAMTDPYGYIVDWSTTGVNFGDGTHGVDILSIPDQPAANTTYRFTWNSTAGEYTVAETAYTPFTAANTATEITGDNDYGQLPIGFNFSFYGVPYQYAQVSSNGYLSFTNMYPAESVAPYFYNNSEGEIGAFALALDESTNTLYVSDSSSTVYYFSTATWNNLGSIEFSADVIGLAFDSTRHMLYAVGFGGYGSDQIFAKYDPVTRTETFEEKNGLGIAVDEDTGYVYLSHGYYGDNLTAWDMTTTPFTQIYDSGSLAVWDNDDADSDPTGIAIPRSSVSYNPLNLVKTGTSVIMEGKNQTLPYAVCFDNLLNTESLTGVTLVDTLPSGATFVSATNGGIFGEGAVTWNVGNVAGGAIQQCYGLVLTMDAELGKSIINNVTVDSNEMGPITQNFTTEVTVGQKGGTREESYRLVTVPKTGVPGTDLAAAIASGVPSYMTYGAHGSLRIIYRVNDPGDAASPYYQELLGTPPAFRKISGSGSTFDLAGHAFWRITRYDTVFDYQGSKVSGSSFTIPLESGWNVFGFPFSDTRQISISNLLISHNGIDYTPVADPAQTIAGHSIWEYEDRNNDGHPNDITNDSSRYDRAQYIANGYGYFIYVNPTEAAGTVTLKILNVEKSVTSTGRSLSSVRTVSAAGEGEEPPPDPPAMSLDADESASSASGSDDGGTAGGGGCFIGAAVSSERTADRLLPASLGVLLALAGTILAAGYFAGKKKHWNLGI